MLNRLRVGLIFDFSSCFVADLNASSQNIFQFPVTWV